MLAESTVLEQVKSCASVSCLIITEPLELLRLKPSEPIASECVCTYVLNNVTLCIMNCPVTNFKCTCLGYLTKCKALIKNFSFMKL